MKRNKNSFDEALLGHLDGNERNKLLKQARQMRKAVLERGGRRVSLNDLVGELAKMPEAVPIKGEAGLVTWVGPKTARVGPWEADLNGFRLAVGDRVEVARFEDQHKIVGLRERRTKLSRPDVGNANLERVIVANVDVVCIVVSVGAPPLHPRLIDRYLIAIQQGGAEPMIIVNKVDLLAEDELLCELKKVAPYVGLDVPIYSCSAATGQGMQDVRHELAGKTCAFVGHSGVGKSSLANTLFPALQLKTGDLMGGYGRGAHTTTTSSLFEVGDGTLLIDTPGIRSFGLGKMSLLELQEAFPEFERFSCRFRDCKHKTEPGCGVREAAFAGDFHRERYETYLRLLEEVC